jgi:alkanesulfonate monooxygenase SsuD/methylene tetrahydromethanopterin reductase-like flavin-dependent oxidoreductase (luciferase family)
MTATGPGSRLPIGVSLGTLGVDAAWWLDSARRLDDAGYRAIWAWDHFVSKGERGTPVLEAWTLMSAAAGVTRQAAIGSFVLNLMNRHPAVLARMATTLQEIAGGRLRLGIGIGGHAREHEAYGIDFPASAERAERLREAIAVLRALWAGGPADLDGRFFRLRDAWARPISTPAPPILVGAQSPGGVRLAAEAGDGWAAEAPHLDRLMPRYLEALAAAGRERAAQTVVVGFAGGRSGEAALRRDPFVVAPADAVAEWRARGADEMTVTARTTEDVDALVRAAERW